MTNAAVVVMSTNGRHAWALHIDDARTAVGARSLFVEFLKSLPSEDGFVDRAELVFGELLGNVVRHAPGPVEMSVDLNDDSIVLHVTDSGPPLSLRKPRLPKDVLSERGRGLFIVEQLARELRVERLPNSGNHFCVTLLLSG